VDSRFSSGSCLIESLKACPSIVHRVPQNGVVTVNSGLTGGTAPGDTHQGGDTRLKLFFFVAEFRNNTS